MPPTMKLAEYLFARLKQLGVGAVHGVPGDYNLTLLDYVEPSDLLWVGNANELNAGYAADGYARIKGMGALITTFGVGELSAINAIAGAYTERAAVVHIVGTPARASQDGRLKIHHTFNDGEYRRFAQMHAHVTVAQTNLRDPRTAPAEIDRVLQQCLIHSRPVYIEVPVDCVPVQVSSASLNMPITVPDVISSQSCDDAITAIFRKISACQQPVALVDGEIRAHGTIAEVESLVKTLRWPTWTTTFAKGLIDESIPNVHGTYRGKFGDATVKEFFESADLVFFFGPHPSSTNSYAYSSLPPDAKTIAFDHNEIRVGDQIFRDVPAKYAIQQLSQKLLGVKFHPYLSYPKLPKEDYKIPFSECPKDDVLAQDKLWRAMATFLRPGDIVLGETGTAGYGCRDMPLPRHTRMFTPVTWLSIGYMLPGAQGAALAQRELVVTQKYHGIDKPRTILLIGDGSFQMTMQELGTIIRHNLNVVIFLINNDGYTIERCIHGLKQKYNDINKCNYLAAPAFMGAEDTYTAQAKTYGELEKVFGEAKLVDGDGLRMVEIFLDREDAPEGMLMDLMRKQLKEVAPETKMKETTNGHK